MSSEMSAAALAVQIDALLQRWLRDEKEVAGEGIEPPILRVRWNDLEYRGSCEEGVDYLGSSWCSMVQVVFSHDSIPHQASGQSQPRSSN